MLYCVGVVITCPDPGTPLYGYRACTTSTHAYGSACSFHCETGYQLNGSERLICADSGRWTNQLPKCESRSPLGYFSTPILLPIPKTPQNELGFMPVFLQTSVEKSLCFSIRTDLMKWMVVFALFRVKDDIPYFCNSVTLNS